MTEDHYGSLAADYHWFFDDVDLFLGSDTPGVRAAMALLQPGARVLDAACGIGIDAAALLRRGFDVTASDASEEMAAATRQRLRATEARVVTSTWADLPASFQPGSFDAIFCIGNSIAHAPDASAAIAAFAAFRSILAPGGMLVLDTPRLGTRAPHRQSGRDRAGHCRARRRTLCAHLFLARSRRVR